LPEPSPNLAPNPYHPPRPQVKELLQANKPVRDAEWSAKEVECIMEKLPNLLTTKPVGGLRDSRASGGGSRPTLAPALGTPPPPPPPTPPPTPHPQVIYLINMSATDYQRKKNKWLPKIHAWVKV
jgi:obg-like ATPase 1